MFDADVDTDADDCARVTHRSVSAFRRAREEAPDDAVSVGALARGSSLVDRNYPELALPATLRSELDSRVEAFKMRGLCESGAHNAAWDELDVDARYRAHLDSEAAETAVDDVVALAAERPVVVVAGDSDKKRSHGPILRERIEARVDE